MNEDDLEYDHRKERPEVNLKMTVPDLVAFLSEGNPGAINVMMMLVQSGDFASIFTQLLHMDDMNIRGCQIWIGFKEHCKGDIFAFKTCLENRDPRMVKTINDMADKNYPWKATTEGASSERMKFYAPL